MKVVIQRVQKASVKINGQMHAEIGPGLLLLVGIKTDDTKEILTQVAQKIAKMRIFEDEDEKMNLCLDQVHGEILSVSQFTLLADTKKGNRPSFQLAMRPPAAKDYFDYFNDELINLGQTVKTGMFGADMEVSLINDGPVTIVLDTDQH